MTQHAPKPRAAPEGGTRRSRIAWLVPKPLEGSGGHRTILQNIDALEAAGHECHVFVEDPPGKLTAESPPAEERLREVQDQFERFFGFQGERVHLGFEVGEGYDLLFATAWYTAQFAARPKHKCKKAYFVQDYEAYFMPVTDGYLKAEDSYKLGLPVISIGRWLTQRLHREAGCPATHFEFCADSAIYKPDLAVEREQAVCAIYQPEKPRRCPNLLIQSLAILKHHRPEVKIYLYGTRDKPDLPFEHEHLGLISVEQCAALYNRCSVGLCISATNPSRIPFEMMACGLPVVDIHRDNNLFDMPENGVLLANPRPEALARAAALLLDDKPRWQAMSAFAREFMRPRSLEHGYAQFVTAVEDLLAGRAGAWRHRAAKIEPVYRRTAQLPAPTDPFTGKPITPETSGAQGQAVARALRERLAAMEELDRIFGARSWQTVQKLKANPLYRTVANARFGPGWDLVDPKEDPRAVLARVRGSRTYKLIAAAKSSPIPKLLGRGAAATPDDPFRPAKALPPKPQRN